MKKLILIGALTLLSFNIYSAESISDFSFNRQDHQLHMVGTYGLNLTGSLYLEKKMKLPRWKAVLLSSLSTLTLMTLKESLYDDKFDKSDMVANLIGTTMAAEAVFVFKF